MFWFNFVLGSNFIFLHFKLIIIHYHIWTKDKVELQHMYTVDLGRFFQATNKRHVLYETGLAAALSVCAVIIFILLALRTTWQFDGLIHGYLYIYQGKLQIKWSGLNSSQLGICCVLGQTTKQKILSQNCLLLHLSIAWNSAQ